MGSWNFDSNFLLCENKSNSLMSLIYKTLLDFITKSVRTNPKKLFLLIVERGASNTPYKHTTCIAR